MTVLMFVEDPGAANYAAGVPEAATKRGLSIRLCALSLACGTLDALGLRYERIVDAALDLNEFQGIVVGTAEAADAKGLDLIDAARKTGIPSVGFVDGPANTTFRFRGHSGNPLQHAPDWLAVPDEGTRDRFIALGFPSAKIRNCGHPLHDRIRSTRAGFSVEGRPARRAALFPDAGERKVVVFAAELSSGLDDTEFLRSDDYTLNGTSGSHRRTDIVIEEFLLAVSGLEVRPYLVLRLHPKTTRSMFDRYLEAFDAVSEAGGVTPVLDAADAVVGLTSVVLDEAALLGRPVLSILPREREREWLLGATLGIVSVVSKRESIVPALQLLLAGTPNNAVVDTVIKPGAADNVVDLIVTAISANNEKHADDSRRHHA